MAAQLSPEPYHVFRGRAQLWTRCGLRVKSYAAIVTRTIARNPEHWPREGGSICVGCAHRMGPSGPVTC